MVAYGQRRGCTVYGTLGCFAAIFCGISLILVNTKERECVMSSYDQLQAFNSIGLVAGVILGVAALFDLANFLYEELVAFFYLAILMTLGLVGLFSYSTVYTYWRPCVPGLNIIPMDITIGQTMNKSVFSADDGQMIGVFVLQILTALCLLGAAFDFYRRGYRVFMSRITYGY